MVMRIQLQHPIEKIDYDLLELDLPLFREEKPEQAFLRRRYVFYMDAYRYALRAAETRWGFPFSFFEAGHQALKQVYLSSRVNELGAEIWWKRMQSDTGFADALVQEFKDIIEKEKTLAASVARTGSVPEGWERNLEDFLEWWVAYFEVAFLWFCVENIRLKINEEIARAWVADDGSLEHFLEAVYRPMLLPKSSLEMRDLMKLKTLSGPELESALSKHREKYGHLALHDSLSDPFFTEEYFRERLGIFDQPEEYEKAQDSLASADREMEAATELVRSAHLPEDLKRKIEFVRWFMYVRTESIDLMTMVFGAYKGMFQAMAERFGCTIEDVLNMTLDELFDSLRRGALSVPKGKIEDRTKNGYAYLTAPHGVYLVTGDEIDRLRDLVVPPLKEGDRPTSVQGQTAFTGKVVAKARVILDSQKAHEIQDGEILITPMTNPEYVPAMRKSAGIITNEGGVLCHAAILSRELRKPCIIGTKRATELFTTGDLIELDAAAGTARIIKS